MAQPAMIPLYPRTAAPTCAQCKTVMSICCVSDRLDGGCEETYRCRQCGLLDTVVTDGPSGVVRQAAPEPHKRKCIPGSA